MEPIKQDVVTVDKYADWNNYITANRFVAFLDIMGFKDTVARKSHEEVYRMLHSLYAMIDKIPVGHVKDKLYITMFSDSIVIFSKTDTEDEFQKLIALSNVFVYNCAQRGIPLKGGVAHGLITVDINKKIFFGQPLIDAFQLEEDVCYYGVVCHNSIDKYMFNMRCQFRIGFFINTLFQEKSILKSGQITHQNASWFGCRDVEQALHRMYNGVSGAPRRYIDNTFTMLERYRDCLAKAEEYEELQKQQETAKKK